MRDEMLSRDELLKTEYLSIQSDIQRFDSTVLTIKAWSVTFSLTSIAAAYLSHKWIVMVVAAAASTLFWYLEGLWKTFQNAHYYRAHAIEEYFAGTSPNLVPMQIGNNWTAEHKRLTDNFELIRIMLWPHVMLPHAAILMMIGLLFCLSVFGWVNL